MVEVVVEVEVEVLTDPSSVMEVVVTSFLTSGSSLIIVTASEVMEVTSFSSFVISSSLEVTDLPEVSSVISSVIEVTVLFNFSTVSLIFF